MDPWVGKLPIPLFWPEEFPGVCIVLGVAKRRILSDFHTHSSANEFSFLMAMKGWDRLGVVVEALDRLELNSSFA